MPRQTNNISSKPDSALDEQQIHQRQAFYAQLANPWFCETLFDQRPEIVFFVKDEKARYLAVSNTLVTRCGVEAKCDLLGKTVLEVFPQHLGKFFWAQDWEVLQYGTKIANHLELHLYDGGISGWCLTHKIPLVNKRGERIGLAGTSRDLHSPGEERSELLQLAKAVRYIEDNLAESLRVADIGKRVGLTISRFERLVYKIYGLKPNQLLNKMRLEAALRLLQNTDIRITDIACQCGYADHSAFTRQFRAVSGMTPSQVREQKKQGLEQTLVLNLPLSRKQELTPKQ